jgi:hypothetical protein
MSNTIIGEKLDEKLFEENEQLDILNNINKNLETNMKEPSELNSESSDSSSTDTNKLGDSAKKIINNIDKLLKDEESKTKTKHKEVVLNKVEEKKIMNNYNHEKKNHKLKTPKVNIISKDEKQPIINIYKFESDIWSTWRGTVIIILISLIILFVLYMLYKKIFKS